MSPGAAGTYKVDAHYILCIFPWCMQKHLYQRRALTKKIREVQEAVEAVPREGDSLARPRVGGPDIRSRSQFNTTYLPTFPVRGM